MKHSRPLHYWVLPFLRSHFSLCSTTQPIKLAAAAAATSRALRGGGGGFLQRTHTHPGKQARAYHHHHSQIPDTISVAIKRRIRIFDGHKKPNTDANCGSRDALTCAHDARARGRGQPERSRKTTRECKTLESNSRWQLQSALPGAYKHAQTTLLLL